MADKLHHPTADQAKIAVINPVTGKAIDHVIPASRAAVQATADRARAAQPAWVARGIKERIRLLRRWADLVWADQKGAIDVICAETGKTRTEAYAEIFVADNTVAYYGNHAPRLLRPQARRALFPIFQQAHVHYQAHGVVGLITPWNYPFYLVFGDLIPALMAGNTAVIKPTEIAPLSARYGVAKMHQAGIPTDVVQIVDGAGETGAALVDVVDCIAFTGSTEVGRQVAVRAAERLIPCSLEMGGKDPLIVLDDADLEQAVSGVLIGALQNAGQMCTSTERVYVMETVYDAFIEQLLAQVQQMRLGGGEGDHCGSLTNEAELRRTEDQINDAVAKGAQVIYGSQRRPDLGPLFFEPTLLVNVDHTMAVMREETFGPLIPVMKIHSEAEAVALANDSHYGLSGAIYTRNMRRGTALARQIDSGDININRPAAIWGAVAAPMGGQKDSGITRRNGPEGMLRFVSVHTIVTDRVPRVLIPPGLMYFTPRLRWLIALRRRLMRFLPFLRP